MPKIIDLFAGLGGIRLGFQQAMESLGLETECVFSSEIKPYAIKAYKGFYGNAEKIYGDITKADVNKDIPNFDFLLAGFPCQPFSTAGKGEGFADATRGTMFFEIERILKEKIDAGYPAKGFLLENVEGLINHDNGNTLKTIVRHLEALGYSVSYKLIDSQYFGLAQSRKRVYIVGVIGEPVSLEDFPINKTCLEDILESNLPTIDSEFTRKLLSHYKVEDIIGCSIKDKRGGNNNIHSWDIDLKGKTTKQEKELLNRLLKERRKKQWAEEIGIDWMDGMPLTENQIRKFYDKKNLHEMLENLTKLGYLTYEYPKKKIKKDNGAYARVYDETLEKGYNIVAGKLSFEFSSILNPKDLAPTLVATDVTKLGVVDRGGLRKLTVREGQRLCGYPDTYSLDCIKESEAFDLLGNTVCVPVIREIAVRLGQYYIEENKKICDSQLMCG